MDIAPRKKRPNFRSPEAGILMQAIGRARLALCLTDPRQDDNPIVFANDAFLALTGYGRDDVLGYNCRFLQGPETDPVAVERLRAALRERRVDTIELVNYRRDGSRFVNALQIGPIFDERGELTFYFGSQLDVTDARREEDVRRRLEEAELRHRLMNFVAVLSTVVRLTGEEERDPERQNTLIRERIRAIGDAHVLMLANEKNARRVDVAEAARVVLAAYARGENGFSLQGPEVAVDETLLSTLALLLHELATNAVKHGALGAIGGRVSLEWNVARAATGSTLELEWREVGGPAVAPPTKESGSLILRRLMKASRGDVDFDWRPEGLRVEARLPLRAG